MDVRSVPEATRAARPVLLLAASQFLLVLDSAIVNVALPSMRADLDFSAQGITWVVNAYALLFGGLLLLGGRLVDVVGPHLVFVCGMGLFVLASAAGALALSPGALVAARGAQGLGAALTAPAAMSLVITLFPAGPSRNRALGTMGAAAAMGGASGAMLGGALTQIWGWPGVLWINVPVGSAIIVAGFRVLPAGWPGHERPSLDIGGALTATAAVASLVWGLLVISGSGWLSVRAILPVVTAAGLFVSFVITEHRTADPLIPPALSRAPGLLGANIATLLGSMAMMPMWFLLTTYLQAVRGESPIAAGAGVLPTVAALMAVTRVAHQVIGRVGERFALAAGSAVAAVGLWCTADLSPGSSFAADLLLSETVTGLGFGLAYVAGTAAAAGHVPTERSGVAAGLYTTSQQVGGAIGLAILATMAAAGATGAGIGPLTSELAQAFRVAAGLAAAAAAAAWLLLPRVVPARRAHAESCRRPPGRVRRRPTPRGVPSPCTPGAR